MNVTDVKRFRENLQAEYDAVALYQRLAKAETNTVLVQVYQRLAETENRHAEVWANKLREAGEAVPPHLPSWRARTLGWLASRFGAGFVLPTIAGIEQGASSGYDGQPDAVALGMPGDERSHARVFRYLSHVTPGLEGSAIARLEGRHRAAGGNALRAGVLGANDGLLSVFSLASALTSAVGLFVIGAFITLMTGRNPILSGLRMVLFGLLAATATFGLGRLIGVSLG